MSPPITAHEKIDSVFTEVISLNKQEREPFEGIDVSWQNGSDRRSGSIFKNLKYFTPSVLIDFSYTHSFNNPNDNTVVGSTALARNNEIQLTALHFGGDFYYHRVRARVMTQFGTRSVLLPRNDFSVYKGQHQLAKIYRYISEIYVGYHINKWYGINIDAGLFASYIGLNSYYNAENWEYQCSFTADNTPLFFNGIRLQVYPTKNTKAELLLINGWQSYARFNNMPGIGSNITWMSSNSNMKLLTNNYYGTDATGIPSRIRFHSDNSFLFRYYNNPEARGVSKMAFSFTVDFGFEKGGGVNGFVDGDSVTGPAQYFVSSMFYNRIWFLKNKYAWTLGGGFIVNPGRYLVLLPTGQASPLPNPNDPTKPEGAFPFTANPGDSFSGWDCSTNFDYMPNDMITFRMEFVYRMVNVPYFAGAGGVTSQTGYVTSVLDPNWRPDLVKSESRVLFAVLFRL